MDIYSDEYQKKLEAELEEEDRQREAATTLNLNEEVRREEAKRKRHAEDIGIKLRVLLHQLPKQPTTEDLKAILLLAIKGMGLQANDALLYDTFTKRLDPEGAFRDIEEKTPMTIKN